MDTIRSLQNQYSYSMQNMNGNGSMLFGKSAAKIIRKQAKASKSLPAGGAIAYDETGRTCSENSDVNEIKQTLRGERQNKKANQTVTEAILNSTKEYGKSIRTQRQQAKDTSVAKKKFHYSFKNMSSQILRSKTSQAARQVVGQAMREVLKLKREKFSGKYDSEEVEAAILHAESMERVARKKVRHLEEEELAKAAGASYPEETTDNKTEKSEAERYFEYERTVEQTDTVSVYANESVEAFASSLTVSDGELPEEYTSQAISDLTQQANDLLSGLDDMMQNMDDLTEEVMDAFNDGLRDLMDEMGFGDLADSMSAKGDDLDPEELKELKMKHRLKEMKEIVEADAEYLKAIFEHLERMRNGAAIGGFEGITGSGTSDSDTGTGLTGIGGGDAAGGMGQEAAIDVAI
ncbi:MAG: hypothetical protein K5649_00310 [Lachnospiraceae bacterium]|nr:hypothetical protein [Lachnospiraceae bacterium]